MKLNKIEKRMNLLFYIKTFNINNLSNLFIFLETFYLIIEN